MESVKMDPFATDGLLENIATRIYHAGVEPVQAETLIRDIWGDFKNAGGVLLPVQPNGTVWVIHRRRVMSATVMFVGIGADGLRSFSVLRGRPETTSWASMQFTEHDIGKAVFLSREAAQAKLEIDSETEVRHECRD